MGNEFKTLATGTLKGNDAPFSVGARVLYVAPHPSNPSAMLAAPSSVQKAALITGIRFYNTSSDKTPWIKLGIVRYDVTTNLADRPLIHILPWYSPLAPGSVRADTIPLVLDPGNFLVGYVEPAAMPSTHANIINYLISGLEQEI